MFLKQLLFKEYAVKQYNSLDISDVNVLYWQNHCYFSRPIYVIQDQCHYVSLVTWQLPFVFVC